MPSAIWTGVISFGLVQVPVKLVSATKSRDVTFNQLEAHSGARIRYKRVSEASGEEVPNDRIVKGHEISPGRYVVVSADELASLAPKAAHTIEIEEFVDLDSIDPLYFEQPYYLVPDEKGAKPYRLLVDAMADLDKVAIGRLVLRSKEHLAAIRPLDGMLVLETMRYADEVLPRDEIRPGEDIELVEKERAMAHQLLESLTSADFDVARYHDEYREALLGLIEQKAAGLEIVVEPAAEPPAKVLDLLAALEASLARTERAQEASRAAGAAKAAREAKAAGKVKPVKAGKVKPVKAVKPVRAVKPVKGGKARSPGDGAAKKATRRRSA